MKEDQLSLTITGTYLHGGVTHELQHSNSASQVHIFMNRFPAEGLLIRWHYYAWTSGKTGYFTVWQIVDEYQMIVKMVKKYEVTSESRNDVPAMLQVATYILNCVMQEYFTVWIIIGGLADLCPCDLCIPSGTCVSIVELYSSLERPNCGEFFIYYWVSNEICHRWLFIYRR